MAYVTRAGKGSALTANEHDGNLLALQRGLGLDPVVLDNATATPFVLTEALHGNREIFINRTAPIELRVDTVASGNGLTVNGMRFYGTNLGSGNVTLVPVPSTAANLTGDAGLPSTIQQYGVFDIIRTAINTYIRRA